MDESAASISLIAIWHTGEEHLVEVLVGKPYEQDEAWNCCVSILWPGANAVVGLHRRPLVLCGNDALQALAIGLRFVDLCLGQFIEHGGQLLYPEDRTPFPLAVYFPKSS